MEKVMSVLKLLIRHYVGPGVLAGLIATVPMTVFMLLAQRFLPGHQQYALPPERITTKIAKRLGFGHKMDKPKRVGASLLAHFGYGANMGAMYVPFTRWLRLPPFAKGAVFGLIVWAGSYFGLLPALKLPEQAPKQPAQRNLLMIVAHLIWGTTLGAAEDVLERSL